MKTDYICNMLAGKDLDILIAEKVMGLCAHDWQLIPSDDDGVHRVCKKCHLEFWGLRPPLYGVHYGSYSTDISAAWEVVEKMNEKWSVRAVSYYQSDCVANIWDVTNFDKEYHARADTVPLAICRAALLAIEFVKG
jgi:hypothetical protein